MSETTSSPDEQSANPWDRILSMVTLSALVVLVTVVGFSYWKALTYPGEATVAVRTVDWVRDHGGGPVVDALENWWYSSHKDTSTAKLLHGSTGANVPPALRPLNPYLLSGDGEGVWQALPTGRDGDRLGYATFLRPDLDHPDVRVGIARFDQSLVSTQLVAGTREPVPDPSAGRGQVPARIRPQLVATFNSGYKAIDANGGYYADHRELRTLRDGAASAVIDDAGRLTINKWGRDAHFSAHIVAVRQNLDLILDQGRPVSGLDENQGERWGRAGSQHQYTWRSAIGSDAAGNLYYVGGDQLTLTTLAKALSATGALRGMELDIHPNMVHLFTYRHDKGAGEPNPSKLLDTMRGPVDRYLTPDRRDFFVVTRR